MILALLRSMRPKQWTKNLLVFAGLLFTIEQLHSADSFWRVAVAFALFCMVSGAVYVLNDAADANRDRYHPTKRKRPIASGIVPIPIAVVFGVAVAGASVWVAFRLDYFFGLILAAYLLLTTAYSVLLKHWVIVDLLVIAAGFVMRAVAGAVVIHVTISQWFLLCTTLLALFLGLAKRRHELTTLEDGAADHRKILEEYSVGFLDQMITITAAAALMAYSLYTVAPVSEAAVRHPYAARHPYMMMATIPFVIYGMFRYLYLIHMQNAGGQPEQVLLDDKPLLLDIALWAGAVALILKFG